VCGELTAHTTFYEHSRRCVSCAGRDGDAVVGEGFGDAAELPELEAGYSSDNEDDRRRRELDEHRQEVEAAELREELEAALSDSEETTPPPPDEDPDDEPEGGGAAGTRWRDAGLLKLFQGSPDTVRAACVLLEHQRVAGVPVGSGAFEDMLRLNKAFLPQPNNYPPSLYAIHQVLSTPNAGSVTRHLCRCGMFAHLPKKQWRAHASEQCAECKEWRFAQRGTSAFSHVSDSTVERVQASGVPRPLRTVYYFGVKESIRSLFKDENFCAERRLDRDGDLLKHTVWGGKYFEEVNVRTNGALFDKDNGAYEIGMDWVSPFKWNQKFKLGVVALRSLDLPMSSRGSMRNVKTLFILPGPKESNADDLEAIFREVHREFDDLEAHGITVYDPVLKKTHGHKAYLLSLAGDTPVQTAYGHLHGHTAFWGCGRCFFQGLHASKLPGGTAGMSGVYFQGYNKLQQQPLKLQRFDLSADGSSLRVWPPVARVEAWAFDAQRSTHDLVKACGENAAKSKGDRAGPAALKERPPLATGVSFMACRRFFNLVRGFAIPLYHKFLYGVLKTFMNLALPKTKGYTAEDTRLWVIRAGKRAEVSKRGLYVRSPVDSTRPYKDVVTGKGSYTMEDWGAFVGTYGRFVLCGAWEDPVFYYMFCLLSEAYHVFFNSHPLEAGELDHGRDCMQAFARLVEKHGHFRHCTQNLHVLACHLVEEFQWVGQSGTNGELWVERAVQREVKPTRNRSARNVPVFLVNNRLEVEAAAVLFRDGKLDTFVTDRLGGGVTRRGPPAHTTAQLLAMGFDGLPPTLRERDAPEADGGEAYAKGEVHFSSVGTRLDPFSTDNRERFGHLKRFLCGDADAGIGTDDGHGVLASNANFAWYEFSSVTLPQGVELKSQQYNQSLARSSTCFECRFEKPNGSYDHYIGEAVSFWLVLLKPAPPGAPRALHLCMPDLFHNASGAAYVPKPPTGSANVFPHAPPLSATRVRFCDRASKYSINWSRVIPMSAVLRTVCLVDMPERRERGKTPCIALPFLNN
jgi:hypothetical protein